MGEGETAVDLRFCGILRGEEIVKLFLGIDFSRVLLAEREGAVEEVLLDCVEESGRLTNELGARQE